MKRRSPIQGGLLRLPGDSIREQLVELAFNDLLPALMGATLLSIMALVEWQASIHRWSRHPAIYGAAAALAVVVCIWRFKRALPRIRALQLGRDGEISVAVLLDSVRCSGQGFSGHGFVGNELCQAANCWVSA